MNPKWVSLILIGVFVTGVLMVNQTQVRIDRSLLSTIGSMINTQDSFSKSQEALYKEVVTTKKQLLETQGELKSLLTVMEVMSHTQRSLVDTVVATKRQLQQTQEQLDRVNRILYEKSGGVLPECPPNLVCESTGFVFSGGKETPLSPSSFVTRPLFSHQQVSGTSSTSSPAARSISRP